MACFVMKAQTREPNDRIRMWSPPPRSCVSLERSLNLLVLGKGVSVTATDEQFLAMADLCYFKIVDSYIPHYNKFCLQYPTF